MASESRIIKEPGKILVVDDEANIRRGLRAILTKDGHTVKDAGNADEALSLLVSFSFEVAIIDIRMPGMSGVALLKEIRVRRPHVSVILLTGHGTLETAMEAIKQGAHDYLLKPAQPDAIRQVIKSALMTARRNREQAQLFDSLRAGLQRMGELPTVPAFVSDNTSTRQETKRQINIGDLQIDLKAYEVRQDNSLISLTPSEFQLLVALAERAGDVVGYITLVQLSLDYEAEPWEAKELIKRHVFSLRQKIEPEPSNPRYILNVRGIGYRLVSPQDRP